MTDGKQAAIGRFRLALTFVCAIVWLFFSLIVAVMHAEAEDPPNGVVIVPWWLRACYAITAFPLRMPSQWHWLRTHFGERAAFKTEIFAMLLNSLVWGWILSYLFGWMALFLTTKYRRKGKRFLAAK